jgi:protocatechuate 3,4-dioxygenase beta subunit
MGGRTFESFEVLKTDAEGRYKFKAIKPGAYPVSPGLSDYPATRTSW